MTEQFTDREWEELASMLSDEKDEHNGLLGRFNEGDSGNSARQWKNLRAMSDGREIDVDKAWNNVQSRLAENDLAEDTSADLRIGFMRSTFFRAAAAAIILITISVAGYFLNDAGYLSRKNTVIAANDQKNVLVSLPDGSRIYLNRNSKFSYRNNFGKHGRNVALEGEAFFEIAPDTSKPFIIDAGKAMVKVVGTTFNVITSNKEESVEVFVTTGKVLLSDQSGSHSLMLNPGDVGTMSGATTEKNTNHNPNYISWKTGYLDYNGQKLSVVFKDLKRVYNMDIVADDPSILEYPWSSPIDNVEEETIIRLICASFNLSYTKDGNVYHLTKK
jgi:transmembrane sensor